MCLCVGFVHVSVMPKELRRGHQLESQIICELSQVASGKLTLPTEALHTFNPQAISSGLIMEVLIRIYLLSQVRECVGVVLCWCCS